MLTASEARLKAQIEIYNNQTLREIINDIETSVKTASSDGYMCVEFSYVANRKLTVCDRSSIKRFLESYGYEVDYRQEDDVLWMTIRW